MQARQRGRRPGDAREPQGVVKTGRDPFFEAYESSFNSGSGGVFFDVLTVAANNWSSVPQPRKRPKPPETAVNEAIPASRPRRSILDRIMDGAAAFKAIDVNGAESKPQRPELALLAFKWEDGWNIDRIVPLRRFVTGCHFKVNLSTP